MASIAHQNETKRRGFRAFFSRKSKSSTGDSSISSGSAGDRSISPARSDESVENTSRPLSPASSTAGITEPAPVKHRKHERRLPRPSSLLSLARGKKRPAPRPPANGLLNGKEKGHNSKSSTDLRVLPQQKNAQLRIPESNGKLPPSNLTTALSKSTPTLVPTKGKRKAPPPPSTTSKPEPETLVNEIIVEESPTSKRRDSNNINEEGTTSSISDSNEATEEVSSSLASDHVDKNEQELTEVESLESSAQLPAVENKNVPSIEPTNSIESSTSNPSSRDPSIPPGSSPSSTSHSPEPSLEEIPVKPDVKESNKTVVTSSNIVAQNQTQSSDVLTPESSQLTVPASSSSPPDLVIDLHVSNISSDRLEPSSKDLQIDVNIISRDPDQPLKSILKKSHLNHQNLPESSEDFPVHKANIPEDYESSSDEEKIPVEQPSNPALLPTKVQISNKETSHTNKLQKVFDENFEREFKSQFPPEEKELSPSNHKLQFSEISHDKQEDSFTSMASVGSHSDKPHESAVSYSESIRSLSCEDAVPVSTEEVSSSSDHIRSRDRLSSSSSSDSGDFEDSKSPEEPLCEAFNMDIEESKDGAINETIVSISSDSLETKIENEVSNDAQTDEQDQVETKSLVEELKQAQNYNNESPSDWVEVQASNYNVVLSMTPESVASKASGSVSTSASFQSLVNRSFNGSPELKASRSGTESSYESAPPPLPETPIPDTDVDDAKSVFSNISFSSSDHHMEMLSRQSSVSDLSSRGDERPKAAFSISTYTNRAQEGSYDKKLLRSESCQDISKPKQIEELEEKRSKLTEASSTVQNSEKTESQQRPNSSYGMNRVGEIKARMEQNTDESNIPRRPWSSMDTWRNKSEKPQVPPKKFKEYQKYSCTGERPKVVPDDTFQLRKAKSTADIRVSGDKTAPEKDLDQEYMKLQDDFLKWQHQLLQNQSLLHNRVVPIAANPPTLSSTGLMRNMMMQMPGQPNMPVAAETQKPREINIPIRFEDDDSDQTPAPASNIQVNHRNQQMRASQPSSGNWNSNAPSWENRPSNVECVIVNDPPQVFQAPNDPSFMPIFFTKERMGAPTQSFQRPQQSMREPQQNFGSQQKFSNAPSFSTDSYAQPTSSGYELPRQNQNTYQQQYQPQQQTYQPAQQNYRLPQQQYQQPSTQQQYQQPSQQQYQQAPQQQYQQPSQQQYQQPSQPQYQQQYQAPQQSYQHPSQQFQPTYDSRMSQQNQNYMPQQQQTYGRPQTTYNNAPSAGEEDLSNRFKSVVTLSNDMPSPTIGNSRPEPYQPGPKGYQQPEPSKPFHSKIISNAIKSQAAPNENRPTPSPAAPVSSRLVQAVKQPSPEVEVAPVSPPKREKKKSLSPVTKEPSPPFSSVPMRSVSPPKPTPPRPSEPMMDAPAPPPPPPPSAPIPPPPPANLGERRTSTGKKIISSDKPQELDAREELMMAIRNFGGSGHLRKTGIRDLEQ